MVPIVKWVPFLFLLVDKIWLNVEFVWFIRRYFVPLLVKSRDSPEII